MRICFDGPISFTSQTGPSTFASRLATQFLKMGNEVVPRNEPHDIFLSFIEATGPAWPGAKRVLRLDGIWFKPDEIHKNLNIKQSYFGYEHVIFQSEFDKEMIEKWFGKRSDCSVIGNGIDLNAEILPLNNLTINLINPAKIFVCSSNWHGGKRLKDNIILFHNINKQLGGNAALYVLGSGDTSSVNTLSNEYLQNVIYVGQQSHELCLRYYKTADCFIHLAFLDHCPQVVVEALSQDCPVIYASDGGGVKELVKLNGYEIKSSKKYDFSLTNYEKPEEESYVLDIDSFVLPEQLITTTSKEHIDIELIAKKYIEVFKS